MSGSNLVFMLIVNRVPFFVCSVVLFEHFSWHYECNVFVLFYDCVIH